ARVFASAADAGRFDFWPKAGTKEWLAFITAFLTLAIGSIPQQDIFQRVTSARNEDTAVRGTLLGGAVYFAFAFVPIYIVCASLLIDPALGTLLSADDARETQQILPAFILGHTPMWIQVLFFGALLSAILSTASGAIIAPASLVTENIIKPLWPRISDRQFLLTLRVVLLGFTLAALLFALNSKKTMYDMIQNAYTVTLVSAFVPLAAGVFWKRANNLGAVLSAVLGLVAWLAADTLGGESATVPAPLIGLAISTIGMIVGSYAPRGHARPAAT
ncbi:MAG: sodium:solute symporter family transporter, partial [Burkholderiales bacterium]